MEKEHFLAVKDCNRDEALVLNWMTTVFLVSWSVVREDGPVTTTIVYSTYKQADHIDVM